MPYTDINITINTGLSFEPNDFVRLVYDDTPTTSTTTSTTTGVPTTSTTSTTTTSVAPTTSTTTSTTTEPPTTTTTTSTTTLAPTTTTTSTTTSTTTTSAGSFIIRNVNGSGQITNVYTTGGALFYVINTGAFPVTNGNEIVAGLASLTASPIFVDFSGWTSNSCLSVYINGVLQNAGTTSITSSGTTWFVGNYTFTTSDVVLIEYNLGLC
jgi:hypothetical protein